MRTPSPPEKIAVGVIGAGWWGPKLIRTFSRLPGSRVKTVADLGAERLRLVAAQYPGTAVTTDYREILRDPDIRAVCVATPMETHYAVAKDALEAGKHILLEKPMTTDAGEAAALVHMAREKGLTLLVDHIFLYSPAVSCLKKLIGAGEMGALHYTESTRINLGPPTARFNVLWDLGPHDISIALFLFGESPERVSAHGSRFRHPRLEDVTALRLFFPGGRFATIHVSWLGSAKTRITRLFCGVRSAVYDEAAAQKVIVYGRGADTRLSWGACSTLDHSYGPDATLAPPIEDAEPLMNEGRDFLECIATGREPVSSGRLGARVVAIIEAAGESMRRGGEVVPVAG
jgi:predicted dehydrogenase